MGVVSLRLPGMLWLPLHICVFWLDLHRLWLSAYHTDLYFNDVISYGGLYTFWPNFFPFTDIVVTLNVLIVLPVVTLNVLTVLPVVTLTVTEVTRRKDRRLRQVGTVHSATCLYTMVSGFLLKKPHTRVGNYWTRTICLWWGGLVVDRQADLQSNC